MSFVPMEAVSDVFGKIVDHQTRPLKDCGTYTIFQEGDIIWAKITPCMENGKSALATNLVGGFGFGSTEFHVFRCKSDKMLNGYLHHLLRLQLVRRHARLFFTGSSGHQRVDAQFFRRLEIPLPPTNIQSRIIDSATAMQQQARQLFRDAEQGLEDAKRVIEALILGEKVGA